MLAASYYRSAINIGQDIEAMNCLGLMFEDGLGIEATDSLSYQKRMAVQRRLSSSREKDDKDLIDDERFANHPHRSYMLAQNKYLQALRIEPNYSDALFNLGNLKYRLSSSINLHPDSDP